MHAAATAAITIPATAPPVIPPMAALLINDEKKQAVLSPLHTPQKSIKKVTFWKMHTGDDPVPSHPNAKRHSVAPGGHVMLRYAQPVDGMQESVVQDDPSLHVTLFWNAQRPKVLSHAQISQAEGDVHVTGV